jgi:hypothetical protein
MKKININKTIIQFNVKIHYLEKIDNLLKQN